MFLIPKTLYDIVTVLLVFPVMTGSHKGKVYIIFSVLIPDKFIIVI